MRRPAREGRAVLFLLHPRGAFLFVLSVKNILPTFVPEQTRQLYGTTEERD